MKNINEIIAIAKDITHSPMQPVQSHKLSSIKEYLNDIGASYIEDSIMGILVNPNKDKIRSVIVNHYDLIPMFNRAKNEQIFVHKEIVSGALDNSIVNAVILYMLKNEMIPDDISVLFSDHEETGFYGVKEFFSKGFHTDGNFYINLDVTTQINGESFAIEYDQWKPHVVESIKETMCSMESVALIHNERYADDLSAVLRLGANGTSFCLATTGTIHSYKCATKKQYISDFLDGLSLFI